MDRNLMLLRHHGGKPSEFRSLPEGHRKALVWYMAADGTAWEPLGNLSKVFSPDRTPADRVIDKTTLAAYTAKYGGTRFWYGSVPSGTLKAAIRFGDKNQGGFRSFTEYHRWYVSANSGVRLRNHPRKNRWPCILSEPSEFGEVFQDGWHRFHTYILQGAKKIPCVAFAGACKKT